MDFNQNPSTNLPPRDPDEINLLEYIYVLVKNKWWIIGFTVLGLALGYVAAIVKGPTFVAETIIGPKESETQKAPTFAGLGALGGLVASQLNMTGNASLEKIELILGTKEFNAELIDKYQLLPTIYKHQWPKEYKMFWDSTQKCWKPTFPAPERLGMGHYLIENFLKIKILDNKTMVFTVKSKDSTVSVTLAKEYMEFLDEYIKTNVQNDAKENVDYLEKQLVSISDPLLREKIQALIANEIENKMMVSKEAFKIIDPLYFYKANKQKRMYPILLGFALFFASCFFCVIQHAFSSQLISDSNKQLISNIKKELFFIRRNK